MFNLHYSLHFITFYFKITEEKDILAFSYDLSTTSFIAEFLHFIENNIGNNIKIHANRTIFFLLFHQTEHWTRAGLP